MLKMLKGVKEVTAEDLEEVVHAVGHVQDQEIVDGGIGVVQESGKIYSVISIDTVTRDTAYIALYSGNVRAHIFNIAVDDEVGLKEVNQGAGRKKHKPKQTIIQTIQNEDLQRVRHVEKRKQIRFIKILVL